jgi:hypothetical protein
LPLFCFPAFVDMNSKSISDNFTFFESNSPEQLYMISLKTLVPIENIFPLGPSDEKCLYASRLYKELTLKNFDLHSSIVILKIVIYSFFFLNRFYHFINFTAMPIEIKTIG